MKKAISIICIIALLTTMLSSVVFGADFLGNYDGNDVLVNEDFSSVTGYKTNDAFGNSSFKVLSNIENASVENETLKYSPTSGAASKIFLQTGSPLSGDFTIEFKFMQPTVGTFSNLFFLSDTSTGNGMRIALDGGQIRVGDVNYISPVKGYSANNWYNIKIVFSGVTNSATGTYDVYVGDTKVVTGNELYNYPGKAKDPVCRMIMWGTKGNATTYYDDFKVYREVKFDENSGITRLAYEDFSTLTTIPKFTRLSNEALEVVSSNNATIENGRLKLDGTKGNNANIYADVVKNGVLDTKQKYVVEFDFTQDDVNKVSMLYAAGGFVGSNVNQVAQITLMNGLFYYSAKGVSKSFLNATKKGTPYNFKIYIDEESQTYDVYVDGTCYADDAVFMDTNVTDVTRVFMTNGGGCDVHYIDNLAVYSDRMLDALESIKLIDMTTENKIYLPTVVDGFEVKWSSSNSGLISTDGTIKMPPFNMNSMMTASITVGERTIAKTKKVIVLAPVGLKISYANSIVSASAYYPGKLYQLTPNPVIVTAIYKEGKLYALSYGGARVGDYYNYDVDTSMLKAGNYTAKAFILRDLKNLEPLAEATAPVSFTIKAIEFTADYDAASKTLTINGSDEMPEYASFAETPWSEYADAETIKIGSRIASISANSLTGFKNLERIVIPDTVAEISAAAFPNKDFEVKCNLHTAAASYAEENDKQIKLEKLRILSIGNSHTQDHTAWMNDIQKDMYNAGLDTQIVHSVVIRGARQMYRLDSERLSHLSVANDPTHVDYHMYESVLNGENTWDLIIIQDWHESSRDDYANHFVKGLGDTVAWLKSRQPQAKVAWVMDWAEKGSFGLVATDTLEAVYANITGAKALAEAMTQNKPDYIIPMSTAMQNVRTSYLGNTYNDINAYTNYSYSDWDWNNQPLAPESYLNRHTVLERDGTHCSMELGRYAMGAAVYGAIMDTFKDVVDSSADFDYFTSLKTAPKTTGADEWKGEFNDSIWAIVKEAAANAIVTDDAVTQSKYTVDPADAIATAIANADYSNGGFTAAEIATIANAAQNKVKIAATDVTVNDNSATVKFLYGYTAKTVNISK